MTTTTTTTTTTATTTTMTTTTTDALMGRAGLFGSHGIPNDEDSLY